MCADSGSSQSSALCYFFSHLFFDRSCRLLRHLTSPIKNPSATNSHRVLGRNSLERSAPSALVQTVLPGATERQIRRPAPLTTRLNPPQHIRRDAGDPQLDAVVDGVRHIAHEVRVGMA